MSNEKVFIVCLYAVMKNRDCMLLDRYLLVNNLQ